MKRKTAKQFLLEKAKADIKNILDRKLQVNSETFTAKKVTNALLKNKNELETPSF